MKLGCSFVIVVVMMMGAMVGPASTISTHRFDPQLAPIVGNTMALGVDDRLDFGPFNVDQYVCYLTGDGGKDKACHCAHTWPIGESAGAANYTFGCQAVC